MRKFTVFNAESAYFYFTDAHFRRAIIGSEHLFCDSFSLSLVLHLCGISHRRLHGPDLMHKFLLKNAMFPILIIGGSKDAHEVICSKYDLQKATCIDQQLTEDDINILVNTIERLNPNTIFVCLGLKKQENYVDQIWAKVTNPEAKIIGVGAAVDFLGETKKRSSKIWRWLGFEWLPRLVREPRMAPRILRSFLGCLLMFRNSAQLKLDDLSFSSSQGPFG